MRLACVVRCRAAAPAAARSLATTRAIRVDGLTRCTVYTGAVGGSVLLHKCTDCTLMLASRQVRLHTSTRCDFYLHVHSRPIIEHCSALRFAPYPLAFPALAGDLVAAGLQPLGQLPAAAMWREVDDFDWHKVQASPNWSVLPPAQRATAAVHAAVTLDWTPHGEYLEGGTDGGAEEGAVVEAAPAAQEAAPTAPEPAPEPAPAPAAEEDSDDEL